MSNPLKELGDLLGNPAREKELTETVDRLTRRVRELETRIQTLVDLAGNPEQSHRMLTRKEIVRTLRGES